ERAPFPWDRVLAEARERRPGWRHRIHHELRFHYGAHLHRRLFRWFGVAIFLSVAATIIASHLGRAWLAAHPGRAFVLFGGPALERAGEAPGKLAAAAGALPFVADPTLVARALANLIDNARKHGGGLDRLAVRAGDGTVVFEVDDGGPGFAPGDEQRVFDRF